MNCSSYDWKNDQYSNNDEIGYIWGNRSFDQLFIIWKAR